MTEFMPRNAMADLLAWKDSPQRKPLLLTGARQVGKTALAQEFGRTHFENVAYLQLDRSSAIANIFADFDVDRLLLLIAARTGQAIVPGKTLLILDEIQERPEAITALKYMCEQRRDLHVIASGSYLGLTIHEGTGFPVGKVDHLTLRPMTFSEFLTAVGEEQLRTALHAGDPALWEALDLQLDTWLRMYMVVGGMPEAVAEFVRTRLPQASREVQRALLTDYGFALGKHMPDEIVDRARLVWQMAPAQLAKENRRMVFSQLASGARGRDYAAAVNAVADAGLLTLVRETKALQLPLAAFVEPTHFKTFFLDVGLLGAALALDPVTITDGDTLFEQHKGVMVEQFIVQSLVALTNRAPFYMSSIQPPMELDAVTDRDGKVYVIEVKSGKRVRSASLRTAHERFGEAAIYRRFSRAPYRQQEWMTNLPLYAIDVHSAWAARVTDR